MSDSQVCCAINHVRGGKRHNKDCRHRTVHVTHTVDEFADFVGAVHAECRCGWRGKWRRGLFEYDLARFDGRLHRWRN